MLLPLELNLLVLTLSLGNSGLFFFGWLYLLLFWSGFFCFGLFGSVPYFFLSINWLAVFVLLSLFFLLNNLLLSWLSSWLLSCFTQLLGFFLLNLALLRFCSGHLTLSDLRLGLRNNSLLHRGSSGFRLNLWGHHFGLKKRLSLLTNWSDLSISTNGPCYGFLFESTDSRISGCSRRGSHASFSSFRFSL